MPLIGHHYLFDVFVSRRNALHASFEIGAIPCARAQRLELIITNGVFRDEDEMIVFLLRIRLDFGRIDEINLVAEDYLEIRIGLFQRIADMQKLDFVGKAFMIGESHPLVSKGDGFFDHEFRFVDAIKEADVRCIIMVMERIIIHRLFLSS